MDRLKPAPSLLIASPTEAVRRRWRRGLNGRFTAHAVATRRDVEWSLSMLKPDVLLLDVAIAGPSGVGKLHELSPQTKIILCPAISSEREGIAALKAGARGYCRRTSNPALIRKAVSMVQQGEIWIGRSVIPHLLKELASCTEARSDTDPDLAQRALDSLSRRQHEVAQLILSGASNKEIATRLHITEDTVKAHLTAIFRKLGLPDRLHLALFLTRAGSLVKRPLPAGARVQHRGSGSPLGDDHRGIPVIEPKTGSGTAAVGDLSATARVSPSRGASGRASLGPVVLTMSRTPQ